VIEQTFDIQYMARVGVGFLWSKFDPQLQQRFYADFANWTVANYASEFRSYSGERFEVVGVEDRPNNGKIVKTTLTPTDGKAVVLNYPMHLTDSGWRIIDVYLTGTISELATRRSEFTAIIRSDGPEGLAKSLEQRVDELKAKSK
jgi:phospholipid transport system substrate-binding protein